MNVQRDLASQLQLSPPKGPFFSLKLSKVVGGAGEGRGAGALVYRCAGARGVGGDAAGTLVDRWGGACRGDIPMESSSSLGAPNTSYEEAAAAGADGGAPMSRRLPVLDEGVARVDGASSNTLSRLSVAGAGAGAGGDGARGSGATTR